MKEKKFIDDTNTVTVMIEIYCNGNHDTQASELCDECLELAEYADFKLKNCKFGDKKPVCGKCTVHCYKPEMREKIREVMRYSAPKMIYKHPVMLLKYAIKKIIH